MAMRSRDRCKEIAKELEGKEHTRMHDSSNKSSKMGVELAGNQSDATTATNCVPVAVLKWSV